VNTGGGGGGGNDGGAAAAGGSGIVIVRYSGTPAGSVTGTTNTTTQSGGYTSHTFLESGTLVMT
jgi:hypothetical protein